MCLVVGTIHIQGFISFPYSILNIFIFWFVLRQSEVLSPPTQRLTRTPNPEFVGKWETEVLNRKCLNTRFPDVLRITLYAGYSVKPNRI